MFISNTFQFLYTIADNIFYIIPTLLNQDWQEDLVQLMIVLLTC